MTNSYVPKPTSAAARACAFFLANPGEILTVEDCAAKFNISRGSVHTLMREALDAGLLAREDSREGYVYKAGPKLTVPQARPRQTEAVSLDGLEIKIEKDIPLPRPREGKNGALGTAIEQLQPGESFAVSAEHRRRISALIRNRHKVAGGPRWAVREVEGGLVRIWRRS